VRIPFLVTEKVVEADLPPSFDALPHMRVGLRLVGGNHRQLSFFPNSRFEQPSALGYMRQVDSAKDAAGQEVAIFEQNEAPAVRIAVWVFESGFATAAFNPGNHGDVGSFLASVSFDDGGGAPRARIGRALTVGDARRPVFRDVAMYHATLPDGTWQCLQFSEMPTDRRRDPVPEVTDRASGSALQIIYVRGMKVLVSAGPGYADDVVRDFAHVTSSLSVA
jgi:hypothetical protein